MKIATITLFCREWFRAQAWKQYYDEYREDIYLHVIVNNGDEEDTERLKNLFPDSLVLRSPTSNMMASYNLALKEILKHPEVDAIAQIVNDIRISEGGLKELYRFLYSRPELAMVSPVLLQKDSDVVDSFGCHIHPGNLNFVLLDAGKKLADVADQERETDALPGGIFLARRDLYEQYGFQDEALEMYADEVDMSFRVARLGYRMGATSFVRAWHQHVNRDGKSQRSMRAAFLMGRNQVYVARKHCRRGKVLRVFASRVLQGLDEIRSALMHGKEKDYYRYGWFLVKGAFAGLKMK